MRGERVERLGCERRRDLFEQATRLARSLEIPDGEEDLDRRGEEVGVRQRLPRFGDGAAEGAGGDVGASLREAQQRQPRLRLAPVEIRRLERLLGQVEGPTQAVDLAFLIVRLRERFALVRLCGAAGAARFIQRFGPRAPDLQELGAMNQARPLERDQPGLTRAPVGERGGPLARALDGVDALAAGDDAAIDEAGDDGRDVPRHHGEHGLVEQRHPALDAALANEHPPLHVAPKRRQVRVTDPIADGGRLRGHVVSRLELTQPVMLKGGRQQQQPARGGFGGLSFDQSLGAAQPGVRAPGLAHDARAEPDPERRTRRAPRRALGEPRFVEALHRLLGRLELSRELGGPGQPLEILGAEARGLVARRQELVGLTPRAPLVRLAPACERGLWLVW